MAAPAVLLLASFYSCSEDAPTTTGNTEITFDSARFNWTEYDLEGSLGFNGMWCADSSNIYLINENLYFMTHLRDGIRADYNFGNFRPRFVTGLSNNEVYVFCYDVTNVHNIIMKKWNGVNFIDVNVNVAVNDYLPIFGKGLAKSSNEIWFCTVKMIVKYDGTGFTAYSKDTLENVLDFFSNNQNRLQYLGHRPYSGLYDGIYNLYEFRNNSWENIFSFLTDSTNYIGLRGVGGYIIGVRYFTNSSCLYNLVGNAFLEWQCINNKSFGPPFEGLSLSEFSCIMEGDWNECGWSVIVNWNGEKWSKENCFKMSDYKFGQCLNRDIYFFKGEDGISFHTKIYRGIRKMK